MIQLKTTVSVPTEVEINLETPAFFKEIISSNITKYMAVIEECTISIFMYPDKRVSIENDATEDCIRNIKIAIDSWEHIAEEEFFEALNKALKDFDFKATLKVIKQLNESEEERKMLQGNY